MRGAEAAAALRRQIAPRHAAACIAVQLAAGVLGAFAVHLMFDLPILQFSTKARAGVDQWTGEFVATFGLVLTIFGLLRHRVEAIPAGVSLWIVAAYWFTSSTSVANPAITVVLSLSDSFAGIAPHHVPAFALTCWKAAARKPGQVRGRGAGSLTLPLLGWRPVSFRRP